MKKQIKSAQENRAMVYEVMKTKKGYNPKKFDRKLYEATATELGVFAFGKVVGTYEETSEAPKTQAKKPTKTSRGSSKKSTPKTDSSLEARVQALEKGQEEQKDILLKILAKLG